MALPSTSAQLSPEGQHVIDALEAHHRAVTQAAANSGNDGLIEAVNDHNDRLAEAFDSYGLSPRNPFGKVEHYTAGQTEHAKASSAAQRRLDAARGRLRLETAKPIPAIAVNEGGATGRAAQGNGAKDGGGFNASGGEVKNLGGAP